MDRNRAMEFLLAARSALQYPLTRNRKAAQMYIELAIAEVQEMAESLAVRDMSDSELQRRAEKHDLCGPVLIANARPTAALPGAQ